MSPPIPLGCHPSSIGLTFLYISFPVAICFTQDKKNVFDSLISRLDTDKERTSGLEDMSKETTKTENQKKKKKTGTSKKCGTIEKDVTYMQWEKKDRRNI